MPKFWQCLEEIRGRVAGPAEWRAWLGTDFDAVKAAFLRTRAESAKSFPCPRECGCAHEVVQRKAGSFVAVCGCEPCNCDDIPLTADDVALLELIPAKLGRAIAKSFECDAKDVDLGLPGTKQIAAFGNAALPVVLTIQTDSASFSGTVAQLVAKLKEHFILLAPSNRFLDANSSGLLKTAKGGFFDLESSLIFLPGGKFQARKSGGELFSPYLPQASEPMNDNEARRLFELLKALESESNYRKAPVTRVFQLYCLEKLSRNEVAKACRCVPSLITLRLKAIHKKLGRKPLELRGISSHFDGIADSLTDSRARNIDRERAIDGSDPDDED